MLLAILVVLAFLNARALIDVLLILVALTSLLAFGALAVAGLQIIRLVKDVRGEMGVLVATAKETAGEVQGTARFMGDSVISPVAQAAGFVSATRATLKAFTQPLYKRRD